RGGCAGSRARWWPGCSRSARIRCCVCAARTSRSRRSASARRAASCSRTGRSSRAARRGGRCRSRPTAAAAADVGISATFYQDLIFVLSGAVVGLTGGLYASYFNFIEPNDMFGFERSIAFVLIAVIGGVGTSLGPALGAVVFVIV